MSEQQKYHAKPNKIHSNITTKTAKDLEYQIKLQNINDSKSETHTIGRTVIHLAFILYFILFMLFSCI